MLVLAVGVGAASCADPPPDFAQLAESAITDQITLELGLDSEATCAEPASTAVGTTFTCAAVAADDTRYHFVAEIADGEVVVVHLDS